MHQSSTDPDARLWHAGYAISQQKRKRVEQSLGWMKMIGLLRKVKLRGLRKVGWWFTFVGAAYNLVRRQRLRAEAVVCTEGRVPSPWRSMRYMRSVLMYNQQVKPVQFGEKTESPLSHQSSGFPARTLRADARGGRKEKP